MAGNAGRERELLEEPAGGPWAGHWVCALGDTPCRGGARCSERSGGAGRHPS